MSTATMSKEKLFAYLIVDDIQVEEEILNKAKENDADSLSKIGEIYYDKKDYKKSMKWHLLASDNNNSYSQNRIGYMHKFGEGVPVNYKLAMEWYLKGRSNGSISATNNIGVLYETGLGVLQDYKIALKWYLEAANKGNIASQYGVGKFYERGYSVNVDKQYALEWYEKSAEQGYVLAQKSVKRLNEEGFFIDDRQKRYLQLEKDNKKLDQKLRESEQENKLLRQENEVLKLNQRVNSKEPVSVIYSDKVRQLAKELSRMLNGDDDSDKATNTQDNSMFDLCYDG